MTFPSKINISGMEYEVILSEEPLFYGTSRAYGHINFDNKKIMIDKTLRDSQGHMQTLLHEIVHGIIYDRDIDFKVDSEEAIVDQLANGIYQVFKDNKLF